MLTPLQEKIVDIAEGNPGAIHVALSLPVHLVEFIHEQGPRGGGCVADQSADTYEGWTLRGEPALAYIREHRHLATPEPGQDPSIEGLTPAAPAPIL